MIWFNLWTSQGSTIIKSKNIETKGKTEKENWKCCKNVYIYQTTHNISQDELAGCTNNPLSNRKQQLTIQRSEYLCTLACPPVKSDVACHNVCFLGCGFVSLKKRGCLASCKKKIVPFIMQRPPRNIAIMEICIRKELKVHTTTSKVPGASSG